MKPTKVFKSNYKEVAFSGGLKKQTLISDFSQLKKLQWRKVVGLPVTRYE